MNKLLKHVDVHTVEDYMDLCQARMSYFFPEPYKDEYDDIEERIREVEEKIELKRKMDDEEAKKHNYIT